MRWRVTLIVTIVVALLAISALGAPPEKKQVKTEVAFPTVVASSPAFKDLPVDTRDARVAQGHRIAVANPHLDRPAPQGEAYSPDEVLQDRHGRAPAPSPLISFDGIDNLAGVAPPDTEGDIGPNHYLQWVNCHLAAWSINRTSWSQTLAFGPVAGNTIWTSLGGQCASDNWGDPIVLWDRFRNRWVISQFSLGPTSYGPYKTAIAVSKTSDPTGEWWLYCYDYHATTMNDYPKFGVWPDGYYYTCNQFTGGGAAWGGAGLCVFEADKMISGDPTARQLKIDLGSVSLNYGGILPAHFEGTNNPPAGSGYFVEVDDSTWFSPNLPQDSISLWKANVNWTAGTFTVGSAGLPDLTIPISNFTPLCIGNRNCIPQPGTTQRLDAIADRGMYRCQYRNLGSYETMTFNLTVDSGSAVAGVRWFELRKDGGHPDWYLYQEGTYAPADGKHRWMGSAAQDHMGDLCVGYSISDGTATYPSIGYAGRLAGDPVGTLPQAEVVLHAGAASQTGVNRWGDYSALSIDPVDDCTFWYTQEYTSGGWNWLTRIGAFKFPACSIGPTGTLSGTVYDVSTTLPIVGATVSATNGVITQNVTTGPGGLYSMTLPISPPNYTVTANAFGYGPSTANNVVIMESVVTTQDFALTAAGTHTVTCDVSDGLTGWPLYAAIAITGDLGYPGATIYTNPADGQASVTLVDGVTYTFTPAPWVAGYALTPQTLGPLAADATLTWTLAADASTCNAPGYAFDYKWYQDFESGDGGFTTSGTTSWAYGVPTSGPGSAHSPTHAWATNLSGNYNNSENGYVTSPVIDLSAYAGQVVLLEWWQWLNCETNYDYASLEASSDGGATWSVVYGPVTGIVDGTAWAKHTANLGATYSTATFQIRFHFTSDSSVTRLGWYVDDIGVATVALPPPVILYSQNFDSDNGSFAASGTASSWAWGAPTSGPGSAHSAPNVWATNLAGNYNASENSYITSPVIDLSAGAGNGLTLEWWQYLRTESNYDYASVDVSNDSGSTWTTVYGTISGSVDLAWAKRTATLSSSYAVATFRMRFHLTSDSSVQYAGWYVDDISISYSTAPPPTVACLPPEVGGLIYGNTYDANTLAALLGVSVANAATGKSATSAATPDPAVDEGFYCMYGVETANDMTASKSPYGNDTASPAAPHFGVVKQDFHLAAGQLAATPASFSWTVVPGGTGTDTLTLSNIGGGDATFDIKELNGHVARPTGNLFTLNRPRPLTKAEMWTKAAMEEMAERKAEKGAKPAAKEGQLASALNRRIVLDLGGAKPPVDAAKGKTPANPWPPSGPVQLYVDDGVAEDSIGLTSGGQFVWFNRFTPNAVDFPFLLDQISVIFNNSVAVGDNMELVVYADPDGDPNNGATFLYSQNVTVLNNDLATWNDYTLTSPVLCAGPGDVLVGLVNRSGASGYADYPAAIDMTASQLRSWIGSYGGDVPEPPTFPAPSNWGIIDVITGGSLAGNWTVRASGYPADIPWIDETPKTGTVTAGGSTDITLTYDSTGLAPGIYEATLSFQNDTPYGNLNVPVTLTVVEPVVATAAADVTTGVTPLSVHFTGSATGGLGAYTYEWDFGDGSPHVSTQNPTHIYNIGGDFTVSFTVTDEHGGTDTDNHLVIHVTQSSVAVVYNLYDDLGRARACVNRLTGAFTWMFPAGAPTTTYNGVATVLNGGTKFISKAGDTVYLNITIDPLKKKASGYCKYETVYTFLSDSNITNNPPGCF